MITTSNQFKCCSIRKIFLSQNSKSPPRFSEKVDLLSRQIASMNRAAIVAHDSDLPAGLVELLQARSPCVSRVQVIPDPPGTTSFALGFSSSHGPPLLHLLREHFFDRFNPRPT